MITAILAMDSNKGIGYNNTIPWINKDDMLHFKQTTMNETVIVGSKTYKSLIPLFKTTVLPGRTVLILSNFDYVHNELGYKFNEILSHCNDHQERTFYLIGGAQLYDLFAKSDNIDELLITFIDGIYECDTFMNNIIIKDNHIEYFYNTYICKSEQKITNGVIKRYSRY